MLTVYLACFQQPDFWIISKTLEKEGGPGVKGEDIAFGLEAEDLGVVVGVVTGGVAFVEV